MSSSENNGWIRVDERLPEKNKPVWAWGQREYKALYSWGTWWDCDSQIAILVTHWQYLPSPPEPPEVEL